VDFPVRTLLLLHKKIQEFAADFRTGQHEESILNENSSLPSWVRTKY
jgi:hypothetical protein